MPLSVPVTFATMSQIRASLQFATLILLVTLVAEVGFASSSWTYWARKVGQSETVADRKRALTQLRSAKNLDSNLKNALSTVDRHLALDAIVALGLKEFVPELLSRVDSDEDGFLTLNLNALLDETNKVQIFNHYVSQLEPARASKISAAAIVAMLEPLGRAGHVLPKATIENLFLHTFPEVRSSVIYYARLMSLRNTRKDYHSILVKGLSAGEFQLRLQAVSVLNELTKLNPSNAPVSREELSRRCKREKHSRVKGQCLWILEESRRLT